MNESKSIVFKAYKELMKRNMKRILPQLSNDELDRAIDYSIQKRIYNGSCRLENVYKNKTYDTNLLELTEAIKRDKPIVTSFGCLFSRHGSVDNPMYNMIQEFSDRRNMFKKEMLKHEKGSPEYKKYNLAQKVAKIDNNAIYGGMGQASSVFYSYNVAASITRQGRACITASIMLFESFLANNIKFGSLNEVIMFIDHIVSEQSERKYEDYKVLDNNIPLDIVFNKLMDSCGYRWKPNRAEIDMIYAILNTVSQSDLNRIYYKNNLYAFFENRLPMQIIIDMLSLLESPFIDPNHPPATIADQLDVLTDLIKEFVYYHYQIIDKIERVESLYRQVDLTTDTDSCIITLNPWYEFISDKISNIDMKLKHYDVDAYLLLQKENMNDASDTMKESDTEYVYDFRNKEIIERKRLIDPLIIIPEDSMRHSIINIIAYIIGKLLRDYFDRISIINHVTNEYHDFCLMNMKNEFLFMKMLLTNAKKHYATLVEVQEGHVIPKSPDKQLDIKGLQMDKSVVPESTKEVLSKILYEDILKADSIDQIKIINKLAVLEKQICDDIYNGGLKYYAPKKTKPFESYKNPMSTQQVKASIIYNLFKDEGEPMIDIDDNNSILVIGVNISRTSLEESKLKTNDPEKYNLIMKYILQNPSFEVSKNNIEVKLFNDNKTINNRIITSIAIPRVSHTPKWLFEFIDIYSIVKDNIGAFPLEAIGITRLNTDSAYSGIIDL